MCCQWRRAGAVLALSLVAGAASLASPDGGPPRVDTGMTALRGAAAPPGRLPYAAGPVRGMRGASRAPAVRMLGRGFQLDAGYAPVITGGAGHVLLQLTGPLTEAQRNQLQALGIVLGDYVPDDTWKVKVPAGQLATVRALPYVYAVGDLVATDKLPGAVLAHDFDSRSLNPDGTLSLEVYFHADVSYENAVRHLATVGASPEHSGYLSGAHITVRVPQARVLDLAGLDVVGWIEDRERPKSGHNARAAQLSHVDRISAPPLSLDGAGVAIGMWDEGIADITHPDLAGHVFMQDKGVVAAHATHVAGTLTGTGLGAAAARGMAPGAKLYTYDYFGDALAEQAAAQAELGVAVSNNSWGYVNGWQRDYYGDGRWAWFGGGAGGRDPAFGAYTSVTRSWDRLVDKTGLIIIKSAGNDRGDTGAGASPHYHGTDNKTVYTDYHAPDGDYTTVGQIATAKNVITVGAVDGTANMAGFSAWGPTNDGRLKPDIVADGVGIYSTSTKGSYRIQDGTSMSTPVVSGAVALMVERYRAHTGGTAPPAHLVKALLANTARDLGQAGPDYQYGWGLLDAEAALAVIDADSGVGRRLQMDNLRGDGMDSYPVDVRPGLSQLKFTLAWSDPAAAPGTESALVNDLDLTLVAPDGRVYYPYSLGGTAAPAAPAVMTGPNRVDNIEQVMVSAPQAGTWRIVVRGTAVQGTQNYALVSNVDMLADATPPTEVGLIINHGAYFSLTPEVQIEVAGSDNLGVTGYAVSESPFTPSSTAFGPVAAARYYTATLPYVLSPGDGRKTIYLWLRDAQGNVSTPVSASIVLDTLPPAAPAITGELDPLGRPHWTWQADDGNGIYRYKLNDTGLDAGVGERQSQEYTPGAPLPAGVHTLYVQVRDEAGHWSASSSVSITVPADIAPVLPSDLPAPSGPRATSAAASNTRRPLWLWATGSTGGIYRYGLDTPVIAGAPVTNAQGFRPQTGLSEGTHVLYVQERAPNGQWSAVTAVPMLVDTTPPATAVTTAAGLASTSRWVTLACADTASGCAATYYTLDSSTPSDKSTAYSGPILLGAGITLRYLSYDQAGNAEAIQTLAYADESKSTAAGSEGGGGGGAGWLTVLGLGGLLWKKRAAAHAARVHSPRVRST